MKAIPSAVSSYYSELNSPHKEIMLEMRNRILEVVPNATEIIKYKMPTFVVDGEPVAGLLSNKKHIGYYPYSGSVISQFSELAEKFVTTKGALHIPLDKPLPKSIVRKLIRARLALVK